MEDFNVLVCNGCFLLRNPCSSHPFFPTGNQMTSLPTPGSSGTQAPLFPQILLPL